MQQSVVHRLFWGLVLIGVGAVFLLNQIGVISVDIGDLFANFWPVFLILIGIQGMLIQRRGGYLWNPLLILLGLFFLGKNLGYVEWELHDLMRLVGPVVLILIGMSIIFRRGSGPRGRGLRRDPHGWNPVSPPPAPPEAAKQEPDLGPPPAPRPYDSPYSYDSAEASPDQASTERPSPGPQGDAVSAKGEADGRADDGFSDPRGPAFREMPAGDPRSGAEWKHRYWKEHHQPPWKHGGMAYGRDNHSRFIGDFSIGQDYFELRPMSISHFIGDTKLDLTRAQIPLGETKIYVSSFIGDVKVFVPNDYALGVRVVSSSLVGDVKVMEQKRGGLFNQMNLETPGYGDADRQIVLIVSTFIGDVRVTKVG